MILLGAVSKSFESRISAARRKPQYCHHLTVVRRSRRWDTIHRRPCQVLPDVGPAIHIRFKLCIKAICTGQQNMPT